MPAHFPGFHLPRYDSFVRPLAKQIVYDYSLKFSSQMWHFRVALHPPLPPELRFPLSARRFTNQPAQQYASLIFL